MALTLSWRPDRKPDSETLVNWYDRLDRQVLEIKHQMRRGALGPQQVQALIEHRSDIFPDMFWTIKSQGHSPEELANNLMKKGWEFLFGCERSDIDKTPITTGVTYYLVGVEGRHIRAGSGKIERDEILGAAIKRGYRPVPQEAAIIMGGMYNRREMGGYHRISFVEGFESVMNWKYGDNRNVPHGEAVWHWYDIDGYGDADELFVFSVDFPELK